MKIAFGMIVFNGNYVLDAALESIYPYASQICIAEGPVGYFVNQGHRHSTDGTIETIQSFPDPEGKISLVSGQWSEKDEMVNAYAAKFRPDTNFVIHFDSDEVHYPHVIEQVIAQLETGRWDSMSFRSLTFYGGFDRILTGFEQNAEFERVKRWYTGARWETHRPPTVLSSGDRRPWRQHDHWAFAHVMPHYSYVWPSQILQKCPYYHDHLARGRCIPNYFNRVYLPWVLGDAAKKQAIEDEFDGVHDFTPQFRGSCRSVPFGDERHPPAIEKRLPELRRKLENELAAYR